MKKALLAFLLISLPCYAQVTSSTQKENKTYHEEYSLVEIETNQKGLMYDLMILTVIDGEAEFVDSYKVEDNEFDKWVFTGPPGNYTVRLTVFFEEYKKKTFVKKIVIGKKDPKPKPPKPDEPDEPDEPSDDDLDSPLGLKKYAYELKLKQKKELYDSIEQIGRNFIDVSYRLKGHYPDREFDDALFIPSIQKAFDEIKDLNDKVKDKDKLTGFSNTMSDKFSELYPFDKGTLSNILKELGEGLTHE